MRSVLFSLPIVVSFCLVWLSAADVGAQQVTVSTPYHSVGESFFEHMGTTWGLRGKNWFFSFGAPYFAAPPFGGFDPSAGANFGFGFQRGGVSGLWSGNFSQGLRRSFISQTPSVTLQNGLPGYVFDTSQSPFVISYVPVVGNNNGPAAVGDRPADPSARKVAAARSSSAGRPAVSVDEARRLYAQEQLEQKREVLAYLERARGAEETGKANVARIYYQMAYRRASGELRDQIQTRLKALETGSQGK